MRNSKKIVSLGTFAIFFQPLSVFAQTCTHVAGAPWTMTVPPDGSLTITQNPVTGALTGHGQPDVPCAPNWTVNGQFVSNGQFYANVINPNGYSDPFGCAPQFTVYGTVAEPTCDKVAGLWANIYGSGQLVLEKDCDIPDGETYSYAGWYLPPLAVFRAVLLGGDGPNYGGRRISEHTASPGIDTCWWPGSQYEPWTTLDDHEGTAVNLDNTNVYDDYIGWVGWHIPQYYAHVAQRSPCSITINQQMRIACSGGSEAYTENEIVISIGHSGATNTYNVSRAGYAIPPVIIPAP